MTKEECYVNFWLNANESGYTQSYWGPCGVATNVVQNSPDAVDSLTTGNHAWLVIYSEENYKGKWKKIGPGQTIPDLNHDHENMGSDSWKNNVHSFVVYGEQPSFWNDPNSGGPTLELNGETVIFFSDTDFGGDNITFFGDVQVPNMLDQIFTSNNHGLGQAGHPDIASMAVGTQSYLGLFDQPNFGGNIMTLSPNDTQRDLSNVKTQRGGTGNWENKIMSFWQCTYWPTTLGINIQFSGFYVLFPGWYHDGDSTAFSYKTQDAVYRINLVVVTRPMPNQMMGTVQIDNVLSAASDDHLTLQILLDDQMSLVSVSYDMELNTGSYKIPTGMVKAVDDAVELAGAAGALESLGISEAAAQAFVGVTKITCTVFNEISKALCAYSEDTDGTFYLIPVGIHAINRYMVGVTVEGIDKPTISFNHTAFADYLNGKSGIAVTQNFPSGANLNSSIEYTNSGNKYRTWYQEVSVMKESTGMIVTCKIDHERGGGTDDHVILMAIFCKVAAPNGGSTLELKFAQASVQFGGDSDDNVVGDPVTAADIPQNVYSSLYSITQKFVNDPGRMIIPDVVEANLRAMVAAVQ